MTLQLRPVDGLETLQAQANVWSRRPYTAAPWPLPMLFMRSGTRSMWQTTLSDSIESISKPMKRAYGALYMSTMLSMYCFVSSDITARISSLSMRTRTSGPY